MLTLGCLPASCILRNVLRQGGRRREKTWQMSAVEQPPKGAKQMGDQCRACGTHDWPIPTRISSPTTHLYSAFRPASTRTGPTRLRRYGSLSSFSCGS